MLVMICVWADSGGGIWIGLWLGVAQQFAQVLHGGDDEVLNVCFDLAAPTAAFEAVVVGSIGEGAFGLCSSSAQQSFSMLA